MSRMQRTGFEPAAWQDEAVSWLPFFTDSARRLSRRSPRLEKLVFQFHRTIVENSSPGLSRKHCDPSPYEVRVPCDCGGVLDRDILLAQQMCEPIAVCPRRVLPARADLREVLAVIWLRQRRKRHYSLQLQEGSFSSEFFHLLRRWGRNQDAVLAFLHEASELFQVRNPAT